jgi:hypothetical protein
MILRHYMYLRTDPDWHAVVDDFGNEMRPFEGTARPQVWANAYRFANGQTFEQAGYRSIGAVVAEH